MSGIKRNKKFLIAALLAAGMISVSLIAVTSFASAQNATNMLGNSSSSNSTLNVTPSTNNTNNIQPATAPKIVGTISIRQAAKNFLNESIKVTLGDASNKAASQVNGLAVGGHLCVVQGYLVYTITVVNRNNETVQKVIVDAGNGSVLYTSPASDSMNSSDLGTVDGYFGHSFYGHYHYHHYHHHHHHHYHGGY